MRWSGTSWEAMGDTIQGDVEKLYGHPLIGAPSLLYVAANSNTFAPELACRRDVGRCALRPARLRASSALGRIHACDLQRRHG
jgi:hypothetical protein